MSMKAAVFLSGSGTTLEDLFGKIEGETVSLTVRSVQPKHA